MQYTCIYYIDGLYRIKDCVIYYNDIITSAMASHITSVLILYSTVCSGADQTAHQKRCVTGLCEGNSPVTCECPTQKASNAEMFLFDDIIMSTANLVWIHLLLPIWRTVLSSQHPFSVQTNCILLRHFTSHAYFSYAVDKIWHAVQWRSW